MDLAAFVAAMLAARWRERMASRAAIAALRDRRLRALLEYARTHTRLGAERLAGLDLRDPLAALAQVAPLTKPDLLARFADGIAGGRLSLGEVEAHAGGPRAGQLLGGRYRIAKTSGTTGRVGYFVHDRRDFAAMNGVLLARILRHRLIPREVARFSFGRRYRMAFVIATDGAFISALVAGFRPLLGRLLIDMRCFSILEPLAAIRRDLDRFRPHYLHGYSSFLEVLAHANLRGQLAIDPEFVSLGSEPVSRGARAVIGRGFPRAQLSETYGATECLAIANECSAGRLHVNEDVAVLEVVDGSGNAVPPGVSGAKVYLTNLLGRAQPLFRYELSDAVTVLGTDCPCGCPFASIRVSGRTDDTFYFVDEAGAVQAHPPVPFEILFLNLRGVRQYQLVHEAQNALRVRFVAEPGRARTDVASAVLGEFRGYLERNRLANCVRVAVEPVEAIERAAQGHKLRQIYSEVPRPALPLSTR